MFLHMGYIAGELWMRHLMLMASSLLNPGALGAQPGKLNFKVRTMNESIGSKLEKDFQKVLDDHAGILSKICHLYTNSYADQQDLFQEIAYNLWKALPAFEEKSMVGTWVYSIAMKTALRPFRKEKVKIELPGALPDIPAPDPYLEELFAFFQSIHPMDRGIVALLLEGYERKEITVMTGINEETLRKRLTRLKTKTQKNPL